MFLDDWFYEYDLHDIVYMNMVSINHLLKKS